MTKVILNNVKTKKILHLSTNGKVSWYEIAVYISQIVNAHKSINILPINSSQFPSKTFRPRNSLFDLSEIEKITGQKMPFWKDEIKPIIERINLNF